MYILKNAFRNLGRNKGRNILLGVVLFFIIAMAAVSIVVQTAAGQMIDDYKERFGSEVFLVSEGTENDIKAIPAKILLKFGESDLLQSSRYTAKSGYAAKDMKAIDSELEENVLGAEDQWSPTGAIYGSNLKEINEEFANGTRVIVSGRKYQKDGEGIVSKKFAELNGLFVGDTLTLQDSEGKDIGPLTITGIYEDLSADADYNPYGTAFSSRANEIFTTLNTVLSSDFFTETGTLDAKFFLKDAGQLLAFQKELTEKGLPSTIKVGTDETTYQKIIAPVEGLKRIATLFLVGVLILGSIVLVLISIMAIRERKYEVGVLRAMGMKKGKVALGMLSEVVMITVLCLLLGLGIASQASKPLAGAMLQNQVELTQQADGGDTEDSSANAQKPAERNLQAQLNAEAVGLIVLLSGALAIVSSLSGVLFIMRYEPRRILSERE